MKFGDLLVGDCLLIDIVNKDRIMERDVVFVGVPCVVKDGKMCPLSKRFQLIPDVFDDIPGDRLVIFKMKKNENSK